MLGTTEGEVRRHGSTLITRVRGFLVSRFDFHAKLQAGTAFGSPGCVSMDVGWFPDTLALMRALDSVMGLKVCVNR